MSKKLTIDDFITRARAKHGNKYDYSKVEYVNSVTPVVIICPIHGEFFQNPRNHLKGSGCRECGKLKQGSGVEDLSGFVFDRLKVIERADDHILPSGQHQRMWLCECECGNCKVVRATHLKNKLVKSCGCLKNGLASERFFKDLSGKHFGKIEVLHRVSDYVSDSGHRRTRYLCRCTSCGIEKEITGESLVNGSVISCGNKGCRESKTKVDISGKRVGWLKVLYEAKGDYVGTHWVCECRCGRKIITSYSNLRNETSRSCGCRHRSHLEDDVFNYLYDRGYVEWFENIDDMPDLDCFFVYQKKFDDLTGVSGWKLKFDFAVYKNRELYCLVECQGRQHYQSVDYFGGDDSYVVQYNNDFIKQGYVVENNIKLIEVPYVCKKYQDVCQFLDVML